jgi:beta-ketoacyl-acyl-carrier-protein synthase II
MSRRVVVTGYGMVSPLGLDAETSWQQALAGKSGIARIRRFDASNFPIQIAAELKDWDPEQFMERKEVRRRDPYQMYIVAAGKQAIAHSQFTVREGEQMRTSALVGSAVGGISSYYPETEAIWKTGDFRRITPFAIPMFMVNGGGDYVGMEVGARGPSAVPVSACATGADCIGQAFDLIRAGRIDQALAGAGEAPIFEVGLAAFDRTGACSRENDNPEHACRPFSLNRPGLVFGEGAGILALEALEHAQARGATIHAELVGYGSTSDAFHITAPEPEGSGAAEAIQIALENAGITPAAIDYVNAHGTGTSLNDSMETKAMKRVFGERAYDVPMSSTKSMTGHAMGATAAIEAIFCVQALRDQIVPPTIGFVPGDPECDLDYVPNTARAMRLRYVMSNSFGFGGHNASLIFRAFEG